MDERMTAKLGTILLVDDDSDLRLSVRRILKQKGYDVLLASQGKEALDLLAEPTNTVDLVLSDICMPNMDGMALLQALNQYPIPIVLMTAYGNVPDATRALKSGAFDYILKPFGNDQLLELIQNAIQTKRGIWQEKTGRFAHKLDAPPLDSLHAEMHDLVQTIERVAASSATVLIQGESGVGKEVVARHVHLKSPRRNEPFVAINCAAIPESLLESELFGFTKGSFTGASSDKAGKFEIAAKGTLLLDEISEIPLGLQSKLLRVLQEREVFPIGTRTPIPVDARIIATTNRDLLDWVKTGHFREDLYYRLHVIPLLVPPLRERRNDIPALANHFIDRFNKKNAHIAVQLSPEAITYLSGLDWLGNIRELENNITRIALLSNETTISRAHCEKILNQKKPSFAARLPSTHIRTLRDIELDAILTTLKVMSGNRTQAAEALGITTRTLRNKLKQLNIADSND